MISLRDNFELFFRENSELFLMVISLRENSLQRRKLKAQSHLAADQGKWMNKHIDNLIMKDFSNIKRKIQINSKPASRSIDDWIVGVFGFVSCMGANRLAVD